MGVDLNKSYHMTDRFLWECQVFLSIPFFSQQLEDASLSHVKAILVFNKMTFRIVVLVRQDVHCSNVFAVTGQLMK